MPITTSSSDLSALTTTSNSAVEFSADDVDAMVLHLLHDKPFEKSYYTCQGRLEFRFSSIPALEADAIYEFVSEKFKNHPEIIVKQELIFWRLAQSLIYVKVDNVKKYDKLAMVEAVSPESKQLINPKWLKEHVFKSENQWRVACEFYERFCKLEETLREKLIGDNDFFSSESSVESLARILSTQEPSQPS